MATQEFIDPDLTSASQPSNAGGASIRQASSVTSPSRVELDARVEQARQQMIELRRQQEELEHERQELEELRRREEEFERGKNEMLEELSRTITQIEKEEFETNKRVTTLSSFREVYQQYFNQIQEIRESEWAPDEIKGQLPKAVSLLESARAEVNKGRAQMSFLEEGPLAPAENSVPQQSASFNPSDAANFDFKMEVTRGFARSLPLLVIGVILILVLLVHGR